MEFHTKAFFFAAATLLGLVNCFQWKTVPDPVSYACDGKDIVQRWSYDTTPDETVITMEWKFVNTSLIGYISKQYLHNPIYNKRIDKSGDDFILRTLTKYDSGIYSMAVDLKDQTNTYRHTHSVVLEVADEVTLKNATLEIKQDPRAMWDNATRTWNVRLTCGSFTFKTHPPIEVSWTFPSGESRNSSGYQDGNFYLLLSPPFPGGEYSCHIPERFNSHLCNTSTTPTLHTNASLSLDSIEARLSLLEAESKWLNNELNKKRNMGASVFIGWGRKDCPLNTTMVYDGYAGGKHWGNTGSGTNPQCLPKDPAYSTLKGNGSFAKIHGATYRSFGNDMKIVPCAVCKTQYPVTTMFPARRHCPAGWVQQYYGYLSAPKENHKAGQYVCLDNSTQAEGQTSSENGYLFFPVLSYCDPLKCAPYQHMNYTLYCVVCSTY